MTKNANPAPYTPDPARYDGRMPYPRCGRWGLRLPAISLGCWWNFGGDAVTDNQRRMIHTAFDLGITHLDLANNYGPPAGSAETLVGRIVKDMGHRDELILSTKAGWDMWPGPYGNRGSRKYLLASLDQSLRRLGVEYVDLFYMHRFVSDTPMDEMMGALDSAVRSGKALYVGISSYSAEQTALAMETCRSNGLTPPIIHQANYSMLNRWIERGLREVTAAQGMGIIAFCPLFQGVLTDRYLAGVPAGSRPTWEHSPLRSEEVAQPVLHVVAQLNELARERGQSMAQLALQWVLRDPRVTSALIGASRPQQIVENAKAATAPRLTAAELERIHRLLASLKLPPNAWADTDHA